MGRMLGIMDKAGILDNDIEQDDLPDWPPTGISPDRVDDLGAFVFDGQEPSPPPTPAESAAISKWRSAAAACSGHDRPRFRGMIGRSSGP